MFKTLKYFFAIVLCSMVGNIFAAGETAPAPTDIQKLKTGEQILRVGHLNYSPYYEYINGQLMGLDADTIREAAKRINIKKVEFVEFQDNQKLTAALDQGKINLIASGFFTGPERKQKYLFTVPYYRGGGVGFFIWLIKIVLRPQKIYKAIPLELHTIAILNVIGSVNREFLIITLRSILQNRREFKL